MKPLPSDDAPDSCPDDNDEELEFEDADFLDDGWSDIGDEFCDE